MMNATPSGLQLAFLFFALHFGAMLVARHIAPAVGLPDAHFNTLGVLIVMPLEIALVFALPAVRSLVLPALIRPLSRGAWIEAAGASVGKLLLTFGIFGCIALWALYVAGRPDVFTTGYFTDDPGALDEYYFSTWGLVRAVVAVTLGPFVEELVFRGALYRLWERQWGWVAGALLSSAAFAVIHPGNMLQAFLSGLVYLCLYWRSGSLWAPILCHSLYNLLVSWPLFGHLLQVRSRDGAASIEGWWVHLACLTAGLIAFVGYFRIARRHANVR